MAKADLLAEAAALGLDVTEENTVAEIEAALDAARGSESASTPAPARGVRRRPTNLVYRDKT